MRQDVDAIGYCERLHPALVGFLTLHTGDPGAAEDLAQETLIRVVDRWARVSTLDQPDSWAYRVALNLATSRWRRRTVEARVLRTLVPAGTVAGPDVSDALVVRAAVAALPVRQRTAVSLRYLLDWSIKDAAEVMGCRPGTVQALAHQGVESLRRALGRDFGGLDD
jgi:DNA-directed RNA polymerase specialized sigma24 family protein